MQFVISRVENDTRIYVYIYVAQYDSYNVIQGMHTLEFEQSDFVGLSSAEKVELVQKAMKDKLTNELNLAELEGERFEIDNIYKKSYASKDERYLAQFIGLPKD